MVTDVKGGTTTEEQERKWCKRSLGFNLSGNVGLCDHVKSGSRRAEGKAEPIAWGSDWRRDHTSFGHCRQANQDAFHVHKNDRSNMPRSEASVLDV
jgi:hypothetical protein